MPLDAAHGGLPVSTPPVPFHFWAPGAEERPLLGCMHVPAGVVRARVVLCAPLGYEGLFSHLTLHELAGRLAEGAGAAVLRFDYDGTGDSAGSDEDPGRVAAWVKSVHAAIDLLRAQVPGDVPLVLVGVRAGALLAAAAASERNDVDALVLWAPCASGRAFVREQRIFAKMTANAPPGFAIASGVEANGFLFSEEAIAALEGLNLKVAMKAPAPAVLVLQRAEMPVPGLTSKWTGARVVEDVSVDDYGGMMEPPWLWTPPTRAIATIVDFVARVSPSHGVSHASPRIEREVVLPARVAADAMELPLRFGRGGRRFGILTSPDRGPAKRVALLVTSTFGYRIGPNRLNVALARALAKRGVASFRIDVGGVGDSRDVLGVPPPGPYDTASVQDVVDAFEMLGARGYRERTLSGICAGAFLAWAASERIEAACDLALVNIETWDAIPYTRELVAQFETPKPPWRERFRSAGSTRERLELAVPLARRIVRVGIDLARASVPNWLDSATLGARVARVVSRGGRLHLVFSRGDAGLQAWQRGLGAHALRPRGRWTVEVVDGPDHSFTPRWASNALVDVLSRLVG